MQLNDLRKSLEIMTDEELREHLIAVRRRRETKAEKPKKEKRVAVMKKVSLESLEGTQLLDLIAQLEQRISNEG